MLKIDITGTATEREKQIIRAILRTQRTLFLQPAIARLKLGDEIDEEALELSLEHLHRFAKECFPDLIITIKD